MSTILKWTVPVDDHWHPIGAGRVTLVAAQHSHRAVQVWTVEDNPKRPELVAAKVVGTGHPIPDDAEPIGSTLAGEFVWHVVAGCEVLTPESWRR